MCNSYAKPQGRLDRGSAFPDVFQIRTMCKKDTVASQPLGPQAAGSFPAVRQYGITAIIQVPATRTA